VDEKIAFITGASGLLGRSTVKRLLDLNYQVLATDKDVKGLRELYSNLVSKKKLLNIFELDITSEESIRSAINKSTRSGKKIDVLINCAYPRNLNYGKKLEEVSYEDFCENISKHVGGYYLTSKILCEHFLQHGAGNIINFASIYGTMSPRFSIYEGTSMTIPVEYSAIKSSIIHLTKYFAQYYKKNNIRANCISPGGVSNDQPKIFLENYAKYAGTIGMVSATQVAEVVSFLTSDASIGITGQNIIIDDGFSL
jgi:NAD(P)-dependent dehydrogenase (short-subunit alcohol dehydrogenase family)